MTFALPDGVAVVILDSGIRRDLASSAYNDRRASCERVVDAIRVRHPEVTALRDVDRDDARGGEAVALGRRDYRRACTSSKRIRARLGSVRALTAGDLAAAGRTCGIRTRA